MRRVRARMCAALATVVGLPVLLLTGVATPSGASSAPLTIAFITDQTGAAAASFAGGTGAFEARLDQQNAQGGVNGHKLVPLVIDDQTSPSEIGTAVKEAISRGVIGIVSNSGVFFLGAKYAQQAGIPVTGNSSDGSEWGTQPYTNMFASDTGSLNPKYPLNTMYGKVLKMLGATRLAVYAIGVSPNSTRANTTVSQSFARVGGKTPVLNDTVPYGGVDFTAAALTAKQENVNALWPNLTGASNIALAEAYKQAGIKLKAAAFPVGYDPALINSPAWSTVQGDVFESVFHPFGVPDAGTEAMQAALERYDHFSKTQFPTFSQNEGWLGADLMIKGLQGAGANPTHASVIKSLRSIKSYDGNGLLANPVNYSTIFGHDPKELCIWLERAEKNGFVLVQNQPVCGTDIPGTSSTGSS